MFFVLIFLKNILSKKIFGKKTILDLGIRRFGGYHAAELVESFRMSYKSSQTEQTSPHYDQILHLHLHLRLHLQACAILRHWGNAATGRPDMRWE